MKHYAARKKGNHETLHGRLIDYFNQNGGTDVVVKASRTGNFFFHYASAAMPTEHHEMLEKLGGVLKATHQEDYAYIAPGHEDSAGKQSHLQLVA